MGAYSLDELQRRVVKCFADVPALPREPSPLQPKIIDELSWNTKYESQMAQSGLPFLPSALGKIFRVVPVRDSHSLLLTWQLPSQFKNWRTKPCDYIAHLLGHEAQGSLFSALKQKSWATALYAGVGGSGLEVSCFLSRVSRCRSFLGCSHRTIIFFIECIISCALRTDNISV